jgi:hypothetical protein
MYAYRIRQDIIGDAQVDVDVNDLVLKASGYTTPSDEEFEKLSDEEKKRHYAEVHKLIDRAKEDGILDTDFAYWRKFNHLHGWMEELYRHKGGQSESFNCDTVRLMPDDLDALYVLAASKALAPTQGFFFGSYEPFNDDDKGEVIDFIQKARSAIRDGYAVLYSSWW